MHREACLSDDPVRDDLGSVELRLPSGDRITLFHGDLIGRLWSAALRLDDARISEAHAMVSCRGREMKLLALRGRFAVGGVPVKEAVLRPGLEVHLAPGLVVEVLDVTTPGAVLRLSAPGVPERDVAGVLTLYGGVEPRVRAGWRPDGHGWIWPTGDGWMRSGEPATPLQDGDTWDLGGTAFSVRLAEGEPGVAPTVRDVSSGEPLTVVARYDTVHVQRRASPVLVLTGRSARLVSEARSLPAPGSE